MYVEKIIENGPCYLTKKSPYAFLQTVIYSNNYNYDTIDGVLKSAGSGNSYITPFVY